MIAIDDRVHEKRTPPANVAPALNATYRRGYVRGRRDGLNFEEILFAATPADLGSDAATSRELGYRAGKQWAQTARIAVLLAVLERRRIRTNRRPEP